MKPDLSKNKTIGILGGGQLGRMLSSSASKLGFKSHIYDPQKGCPASQVSDLTTVASYEDIKALTNFAKSVDVVTYEFENIPTQALDVIENYVSIYPNRKALLTSQDRLTEKQFLNNIGLNTAPFVNVETDAELKNAINKIGSDSILKTRRFGYDGKGQARLNSKTNLVDILLSFQGQPCILEGLINFDQEISVIGARDQHGSISCYDPGENIHQNGILRTTIVPARINKKIATDAIIITGKILNALDYIGTIGVELFVKDNKLIVNEIAPRVHNSGHWTQNGCVIDQFEQHVRAITGLPLGDGNRHSNVKMTNLLGDDILNLEQLLNARNSAVHLYGKKDIKSDRKMGHVNQLY